MFRYIILGLLRGGTRYHGYALMKEYRDRSGIEVSTGNFYRELQRLVGEGLVRTVTNPVDADGRRAPYEITEVGAIQFDIWLCEPTTKVNGQHDDELSSRMLFVAEGRYGVVGEVLESWQSELWFQSKMLERTRQVAIEAVERNPGRTFSPLPLLLARRQKHVAADLEFLDEFRAAYEAWATSVHSQRRARATDSGRLPRVRSVDASATRKRR